MAWTTMHFAAGMCGAGLAAVSVCAAMKRGWRFVPAAVTLGGVWALVPDLPRIWREDFPWFPFAALLGDHGLERRLHAVGDLFFFHRALDNQPHEYALHGFVIILLIYNAMLAVTLHRMRRQRRSLHRYRREAHREGLKLVKQRDDQHKTPRREPQPVVARFVDGQIDRSA